MPKQIYADIFFNAILTCACVCFTKKTLKHVLDAVTNNTHA